MYNTSLTHPLSETQRELLISLVQSDQAARLWFERAKREATARGPKGAALEFTWPTGPGPVLATSATGEQYQIFPMEGRCSCPDWRARCRPWGIHCYHLIALMARWPAGQELEF